MSYFDRITALKEKLEAMGSPARLDIPFQQGRPPTQAFSEFLTNKEQGDWAEKTFITNFNQVQNDWRAVKYGRSEDLVAGEDGFDDYYRAYQAELEQIGKRPDLLVFSTNAIQAIVGDETDISNLPRSLLDELVPKAVDAIEVRSSAFLSGKYDAVALRNKQNIENLIVASARQILGEYKSEIASSHNWVAYLENVLTQGVNAAIESPRALSRKSTSRLAEASALTKKINESLKRLRQRDFLSITPKAEDLSQVYRWIARYNVPHHYCQVFFDRAVILSFENILTILADSQRENIDFFIESDEKNQGKVTFKINVQLGRQIFHSVELPHHFSAMKELPKGRLLFYVRFETSAASFTLPVLRHD